MRRPYHFHPRMWPAGAWAITMKIGSTIITWPWRGHGQFPRKRESRVPQCRSRCKSHPPPPLDSGLRRNDGREAAVIFILLLGLGKAMSNSRESDNPGSSNGEASAKSPTPCPWIPAFAGMTVSRRSRLIVSEQLLIHILNTPKRVSGMGAFSDADIPRARTMRVSAGFMMPSSHSRAVL